jgi:hypothetical protein
LPAARSFTTALARSTAEWTPNGVTPA